MAMMLLARYEAKCGTCHKPIHVGTKCYWVPKAGVYHLKCGRKWFELASMPTLPQDRNYPTARSEPLMRHSRTDKYSTPSYSL
jgi:hypothetical protein